MQLYLIVSNLRHVCYVLTPGASPSAPVVVLAHSNWGGCKHCCESRGLNDILRLHVKRIEYEVGAHYYPVKVRLLCYFHIVGVNLNIDSFLYALHTRGGDSNHLGALLLNWSNYHVKHETFDLTCSLKKCLTIISCLNILQHGHISDFYALKLLL